MLSRQRMLVLFAFLCVAIILRRRRERVRREVERGVRRKGAQPMREMWGLLLPPPFSNGVGGGHLAALAFLSLIRVFVMNKVSNLFQRLVESDLMRNPAEFWRLLLKMAGLSLVSLVNDRVFKHTGQLLGVAWRNRLTKMVTREYLKGIKYYSLEKINDPDTRIASDIRAVAMDLSHVLSEGLHAVTAGLFFSYKLARLYGARYALAPYLYLWSMFAANQVIAPINWAKLHGRLRDAFSKYRASHDRLLHNQEAVAAMQGEKFETETIRSHFRDVLRVLHENSARQVWPGFVMQMAFGWWVRTFMGSLVLGSHVMLKKRGKLSEAELAKLRGDIGEEFMLFRESMMAAGSTAKILHQMQRVSGSAKRVSTLLHDLRALDDEDTSSVQKGDHIEFRGVRVETPTGVLLVNDLSFKLEKGRSLLLTGHNGAGKSSIFRCLGGLWRIKEGVIVKPGGGEEGLHHDVYYLPQKPYNVLGTLKDQLTYPAVGENTLGDHDVRRLLDEVDLGYLVDRPEATNPDADWERILSLGEQQRLAIARLLYHKPSYAILDECTSAVSGDMERRLYEICIRSGISYITISHRPALRAYHHQLLQIGVEGKGFALEDLPSHDLHFSHRRTEGKSAAGQLLSPHDRPPTDLSSSPLLRILRNAWPRGVGGKLAVMLAGVVAQGWAQMRHTRMFGDMMASIFQQDQRLFMRCFVQGSALSFAGAVAEQGTLYLQRDIAIQIRKSVTAYLEDRYLAKHYQLVQLDGRVPDPQQRMTDDIRDLADTVAEMVPQLLTPLTTIVTVLGSLWGQVPASTLGKLVAYLVGGYSIIRVAMPNLKRVVAVESEMEGQLQSVLRRVRTHAESIAFFGGGSRELLTVERRLSRAVAATRARLHQSFVFGLVNGLVVREGPNILKWILRHDFNQQHGADASMSNVVTLAKGHVYIYEGVAFAFTALGQLLDFAERIESLSGHAARLVELDETLDHLAATPSTRFETWDRDALAVEGVDIVTPTGALLAHDISLTITPKTPLIVTGPNASGKTSFFRVLAGLWPLRTGRITVPAADKAVFLVPQRAYMVEGSLADQVTYPKRVVPRTAADEECMQRLLELVGIPYLSTRNKEGWDAVLPWEDILSLGEQQRLGMARLFYHTPKYGVLDECTSAVSVDVEERLYTEAAKLGITCITLSQRLALEQYHVQELRLSADGCSVRAVGVDDDEGL